MTTSIQAILDAPLTTQVDVDRLLVANQVGFQEQAMIKKFEIMRDYQLEKVTKKDIEFDKVFTNKELFQQIWAKKLSSQSTAKKYTEIANLLKSYIIDNPEYLGEDGALRLSRPQVMNAAQKLYEKHELFEGVIPEAKFELECTQARATKLVKSLMISLGYKWPKHGYSGNKNLVKVELDGRSIAYKSTIDLS